MIKEKIKLLNRFFSRIDASGPFYSSEFNDFIFKYPEIAEDLVYKVKQDRDEQKNNGKNTYIEIENSKLNKKFKVFSIE
jgi:hypothetical protein